MQRIDHEMRTKIGMRWPEIRDHLPVPGVAWSWGSNGMSEKLKCKLRDKGLIERDPSGEKWVTTERLWNYVISRADGTEEIGIGGQVVLDAPCDSAIVDTWRSGSAPSKGVQVTIDGDGIVNDSPGTLDETFETNRLKAQNGREEDGEELHPGQTTMSLWIAAGAPGQTQLSMWSRADAIA